MLHRVVTLFIAVCLGLTVRAIGQTEGTHKQHTHSAAAAVAQARVLIDGETNPGEIPDELAIKMLLVTFASQQAESLEAKLSRLGFNPEDAAQFRSRMKAFGAEFARYQAQLREVGRTPGPQAAQAVADIDQSIMALVGRTHLATLEALSDEGKSKLAKHLAYLKTRIRVYAPPPM